MIKKLLIANRGEIAVRVIRACREMGVESVAVYSEADKESLHVQLADEAYCIGPKASKDSYLNFTNIISVAKLTGCDAIHPGYGFLAENADFAELCRECNIIFVGPSPEAIQKMGTKDVARETMKQANVPIVPGSQGIIERTEDAVSLANVIGYPVIIKATAGGGGKGIRVARTEQEMIKGINITQQEAMTAFGTRVFILKNISKTSAMLKSRCLQTAMATPFISASVIVQSRGAFKSFSRKHHHPRLTEKSGLKWEQLQSKRQKQLIILEPAR
ncbi:biotin carboxylase of acetyl-CoA carboxylase [Mesobacillus boroniphilus JCM 21738]|uniref:Biotin carboxylase of acetyl-CoA carboxylase n=1 Tax=Mesobacillus boroniphilus JCM 21738 TaxID=1294265 RepID=W4RLD4_9BACI|nr:biotin carboxylase of acetyl-CoA carboxylase [Mesobacillus boroniphilus JCM 21738]